MALSLGTSLSQAQEPPCETLYSPTFLAQEMPAKENSSEDFTFPLNTTRLISKKDYVLGGALSLAFTALPIGLGMALTAEDGEPNKVNGFAFVLALTGLTLGPSAIQAYNGFGGHALAATGLRFAGEAIAIVALAMNPPHLYCDTWDGQDCKDGNPWPGVWVGTLIYAGGVAYSWIQPALHIRTKHASTDLPLHLLPRLAISPQGNSQFGLMAQLPF